MYMANVSTVLPSGVHAYRGSVEAECILFLDEIRALTLLCPGGGPRDWPEVDREVSIHAMGSSAQGKGVVLANFRCFLSVI